MNEHIAHKIEKILEGIDDYRELINKLLEDVTTDYGQSNGRWIPVDDKLPEYDTPVLIKIKPKNNKSHIVYVGSRTCSNKNGEVWHYIPRYDNILGGNFINDKITHWMELPT